jgi:hypothetical protein
MDSNIEEIIRTGNGKVNAFDVLIHEWFAALKNELDANQASNLLGLCFCNVVFKII